MKEWKEYKISQIGEVVGGGTPSTGVPEYWNGEIAWLTPRDLSNYSRRRISKGERNISKLGLENSNAKLLPKGTVLLSSRAPIGYLAIADNEISTNQGFQSIIPNSNTTSDFLYYLLKCNVDYLISQGEGTTFGELSKRTLKELTFTFPPLPEQIAIAEVLSSLDDKIDLLHRQNKTLEQLAETLFREKLKVNSEKWEEKPLSSLIELTLGGEWGKEIPEGEFTKKVCCIRGTDIADLQNGLAERTPIRFIKEKKFESISPKDGDLILEISGGTDDQSTGRTIYINELNRNLFPHPLVFSNFCRLLRPVKKEYSYFLYLYIQYLYKKDEFFNLENGSSGIKNLDYKYLLNDLNFLLPNDESQILEFDMKVRLYFEKINKNKHQIRTLTQLRDTLLPKLMSGEVRVSVK